MTTASLHPDNNEVAREQLIARGWAALPASYRMPANPPSLAEARAWCKQLAESHYENFHVASWFLPEALRPHFHAIYAYCRISDAGAATIAGAATVQPNRAAARAARVGFISYSGLGGPFYGRIARQNQPLCGGVGRSHVS